MRRIFPFSALAVVAFVTTAADSLEEQAMLDAFDAALTAVVYAASGLAVFGLVWAGFLLMADCAGAKTHLLVVSLNPAERPLPSRLQSCRFASCSRMSSPTVRYGSMA